MFGARRELTGRPEDAVSLVCTGPLKYIGHEQLAARLAHLKAATQGVPAEEVFVTAISPTNLEMYFENRYYKTEEEYLFALAGGDARGVQGGGRRRLRAAGGRPAADYALEPRCPRWALKKTGGSSSCASRRSTMRSTESRKSKVRFHTCYSINVAPRVHDLEMKHYADLMLKVRAQAYSIEAANPRHEHEWRIWKEIKLPEHKILIPGVVSHCVYQVEHPELVAERIERFAGVVGRERVIAGTDCGFATSRAGDEVHPDVAWAKLEALAQGARIASARLWR